RRLLLGDRPWARAEPEARHAGRDRAGGDEHHLAPVTDGRDLRRERLDAIRLGAGSGAGDETAADLHHEPANPAYLAPRSHPVASSRWPMAWTSSLSPCPGAAEMMCSSRPSRAQCSSIRRTRSSGGDASILFATTICGRVASSGEYAWSSAVIACQSSTGSRSLSGERSSTWSRRRVRSV